MWTLPAEQSPYTHPFDAIMIGFQAEPKDDQQPPPDPLEPDSPMLDPQPAAKHEPSIFASTDLGVGLFAGGVIGWIVLGLAVLFLERRTIGAKPS